MRERRLRIRLITLGGLLLLAAAPLLAQSTDVVLPFTLNTVRQQDALVRVLPGDILIRRSDLQQAGFSGPMWDRLQIFSEVRGLVREDGTEFVSLKSLAPYVTYEFDEANLQLVATADPRVLGSSTVALEGARPRDIVYARNNSAFLNYSFSSRGTHSASAFGELGVSIGGSLLLNTFAHPSGGSTIRGLSSLVHDDRSRLRRWTFGDTNAATGDSLGGGAQLGGVSVSKNYQIDPYYVRYPGLDIRATALTPSKVDIYVNGMLVGQRQVGPGEFDLNNLPLTAGAGTAQIVIRDAFGREQVLTSPYYYSTMTLAPGVSEYNYALGAVREGFGTASFDYGDPALVAYHRRGFTPSLTLGGRVEATRDLWSAGPSTSFKTRVGEFTISAAASRAAGESGSAAFGSYQYNSRHFGFGATVRLLSDRYATLSLAPSADRSLRDVVLFASVPLLRTTLSAQALDQKMRDGAPFRRANLALNYPIGRKMSLYVSGGVAERDGKREGEYFTGISVYLGGTATANVSVARQNGVNTVSTEIQRPLPVGTGFGYRLQGTSGGGTQNGVSSVQYQSDFGRYEVAADPFDLGGDPLINASGGVIWQGGHALLTRVVEQSFALVRVPGVENVRVYASNQLVGRTNRNGDLLIPTLLPYYGNLLRVDDRDIPLEYDVQTVERTIAPPFRGGALVEFPVRRIQSVTGSLFFRRGSEDVAPSFGELAVTDGRTRSTSPLGSGGEFYFENLPSGRYQASAAYDGGRCSFTLDVPEMKGDEVALGRLMCTETTGKQ